MASKNEFNLDHLGIEVLEVDNKKVQKFPEVRSPKKDLGRNYLIGNGITLEKPCDAAEYFLGREYPELQNCKNVPHNPVFVPETFFYKDLTYEYGVAPEGRSSKQNEIKKLKVQDHQQIGDKAEESFFTKLKSCFTTMKNVIIFSGVEDQEIFKKGKKGEFDFFILSANAKTIIHVECKTKFSWMNLILDSSTNETRRAAVYQLKKGKDFFQDFFKFPEGWKYVKAAFFEDRQNAPENEFILHPESNLNKFFDDHLQPSQTPDTSTYLHMVKVLMFVMFHEQLPVITRKDSVLKAKEDINKFGSAENIVFWTKDQMELKNPARTKVAFYSTYGTGKTVLLKWKIQDVLKKCPGEKVVFIVCENEDDPSRSLLADQIKIEFISNENVIFKCIKTKSEKINKFVSLKEAILQHEGANIFIDEMPFYMSIDYNVKSFLNENLKEEQIVWIAIQWDSIQHNNDSAVRGQLPKGFFCPQLKHPLRTSANIMKFLNQEIVSVSFVPKEINPYHYIQRGPEVKILEIKRSAKFEAVEKVVNILKDLNQPTVIAIYGEEPSDKMTKKLFIDLNIAFVEQADFIERIKEFNPEITKPGPIFLVETPAIDVYAPANENILRGFEIPVLVLFRYKSILYDDITLSRCISNLIIVLEEELFIDERLDICTLDLNLAMTRTLEHDAHEMGDPSKSAMTEQEINTFKAVHSKAIEAYSNKQWKEATDLFTEAIKLKPKCYVMFMKRGECFFNLEKPDACIRDCTRAIEINSNNADAFKLRGRAHKKFGNVEKAFKDLQSAFNMNLVEEDCKSNDYQWMKRIEGHKEKRRLRREEYKNRAAS